LFNIVQVQRRKVQSLMQWRAYIRQASRKIVSAITKPVGLDKIPAATNETQSKYVGGQQSANDPNTGPGKSLSFLLDFQIVTSFIRPEEIHGMHLYNSDSSTPIYSTTRIREIGTSYRSFGRGNFKICVSCNLKKTQLNKQPSGCLVNKLCRRWLRSGRSESCSITAFGYSVVET
jgi:hypothetical protein